MVFSKEDKILIKNLRQLKGTATCFVREFRTKNWTRAQIRVARLAEKNKKAQLSLTNPRDAV